MKEPWEWEEEDILALILDGVQESLTLDYKACDALLKTDGKKAEVSKDVSAFANSAGGTLVYGVVEAGYLPERIDLGYDPNAISREWLCQVINSNIYPRIAGVRINQVGLERTHPGRVLYIVHVPQAMRPHQAADSRYYRRSEYDSVRMFDHEIEDVRRRGQAPDLRLRFCLKSDPVLALGWGPAESDDGYAGPVEVDVEVTNDGLIPAEFVHVRLWVDAELRTAAHPELTVLGVDPKLVDGRWHKRTVLCRDWKSQDARPIFRGLPCNITQSPLRIRVPGRRPGKYVLEWELHAPGMIARSGEAFMHSDGYSVHITPALDAA